LPEVKPTRENIIALVEPVLEAQGLDLVDLEFARMGSRWLVRIYMDREGGVTLQDCSDMSRLIGDILDVNDLPPGPYNLEVSSPGLDRPLKREKDFIKYKGMQARSGSGRSWTARGISRASWPVLSRRAAGNSLSSRQTGRSFAFPWIKF